MGSINVAVTGMHTPEGAVSPTPAPRDTGCGMVSLALTSLALVRGSLRSCSDWLHLDGCGCPHGLLCRAVVSTAA